MKKKVIIKNCLDKYGKTITVNISGRETLTKAVIMPLRYKNKMYLELDITELGVKDNSRMLYIGPADVDFTKNWDNVTVCDENYSYSVSRADMFYFGDEPAYIWAVLTDRKTV